MTLKQSAHCPPLHGFLRFLMWERNGRVAPPNCNCSPWLKAKATNSFAETQPQPRDGVNFFPAFGPSKSVQPSTVGFNPFRIPTMQNKTGTCGSTLVTQGGNEVTILQSVVWGWGWWISCSSFVIILNFSLQIWG